MTAFDYSVAAQVSYFKKHLIKLDQSFYSTYFSSSLQVVSLGITSFTLCALGIDRFHAATSSSQPKARQVERCRSVLLKLLLVWLASLLLSSPEIFLWQLSQSVSPSTGRLVDSCTITPSSPLSVYLPDSLHSLLLRYHQVRRYTQAELSKRKILMNV